MLDIQSDLLDPLATRVVAPLSPAGAARDLGPIVGDLAADRATITAAINFLIEGI